MAADLYYYTGVQMRTLGISMNLAPVAEVLTSSGSFLKSRSYGADPVTVQRYCEAAVRGYRSAGIIPVAKHYPGNSESDPHTGESILSVSREILEQNYLSPFRHLFSIGVPAVLVSHVTVTALDDDLPFCLSPNGVTTVLRGDNHFSGLVITDDISMTALTSDGNTSATNAIQALKAGCDMIMTSDTDIKQIVAAIIREAENDEQFAIRLDDAVTSIICVKLEAGVVPTSREFLARSRSGGGKTKWHAPFNRLRFNEAGSKAAHILEMCNGK